MAAAAAGVGLMPRTLALPVARLVDDLPPARPGLCETCRSRGSRRDGYCSALCAAFDAALTHHAAALHDHGPDAPEAVATRTALRAIAAVYDGDAASPRAAAAWAEDAAAGTLTGDLDYAAAVALVFDALGLDAGR